MSDFNEKWDEFRDAVMRAAGKVAVKAEELGNRAADSIHRQAVKQRLSLEYEKLGRLTYKKLSEEEASPSEELTSSIAAAMSNIEKLEEELKKASNQ